MILKKKSLSALLLNKLSDKYPSIDKMTLFFFTSY